MTRHPLLLIGACGLVVLSLAWATVLTTVVLAPTPSVTQPPVAIVPIEPEPTAVPSAGTSLVVDPSAQPLVRGTASPVRDVPTPTPPTPTATTASPSPKPPRRTPPPSPSTSPLPVPSPSPTPAATPPLLALTCANGVDNGGGTGTICEITIGPDSATVLECHGAAGDPTAACTTTLYHGWVTSVDACNGTANGGGATLRCSVTGVGFGSASVTLCIGTGAGGTLVELTCTWSGTSGVTVRLCNGSANGGGALAICRVD